MSEQEESFAERLQRMSDDAAEAKFGTRPNGTVAPVADERVEKITRHVRKISHYEGITAGQGQVLLAAADLIEELARRPEVGDIVTMPNSEEYLVTRTVTEPVTPETETDELNAKYFHDGWMSALREIRLHGDRAVGEFLVEQLGEPVGDGGDRG